MKLYTNEISDSHANIILNALPQARRNTYLNIAQKYAASNADTRNLAARLYVWNGFLASAVDRTTGEIEVLLRNYMNDAFAEWNSAAPRNGSREWLLYPKNELAQIINPSGKTSLADKAHTETVTGVPLHDDYIAGLTFGNWVHLLPKTHAGPRNLRVVLWNQALLPRLHGLNRVIFQQRAMFVKDMRNRATHRRPLIKDISALRETHQGCVELARAINPDLGMWLRDERWIPETLKESPLK